jgi:tape measure domain-containing protein
VAKGVKFDIELVDKVTATLRKINKELGIGLTQKLMRLPGAGKAFNAIATSAGLAKAGMGGMAKVMSSVVAPVAAIGAASVGLGVVGAKWAGDAISFKENSLIAFKALTGSQSSAQQAWKLAVDFAAKTPLETNEVISAFQKLLAAGYKVAELPTIMAGVGDIGALYGTEKMDQAIGALQKIMMQGKLTGESVQMLGDAGINTGDVYKNLGKLLGVTSQQAQAMSSSGAIKDARTGVMAALMTINEIGGNTGRLLGSAMDEKSQALEGLLSSLSSRPFDIISAANTSGSLQGVKGFISKVTDLLDPVSGSVGSSVVALIEKMSGAFGKLFGGASKGNGLESVLLSVVRTIDTLFTGVMKVGTAFGSAFFDVRKTIGDVGSARGSIDALATSLAFVAKGFGWMWGAISIVLEVIGLIPDAIGMAVKDVYKFGGMIVDGLWQGLKGAWATLIENVKSLTDMLPMAVKKTLGIASPSKVMAELGVYTGQGFTQGVNQEASTAQASMRDMVDARSLFGTPPSLSQVSNRSSSSVAQNVGGVSVQVNVADGVGAEAMGNTIGRSIRDELHALLDDARWELSAA